jgi:hypothetical protein
MLSKKRTMPSLVVLSLFGLSAVPARADLTFSYITPNGAANSGPVNAQADITLSANTITIVLTDYEQNPGNDTQLISGIKMNVSGATGVGVTTVNSGKVSNGAGTTGTAIDLNIYGNGTPIEQIIGPDSKGNFDPTLGGLYDNANNSIIKNHQPDVLGTATFIIHDPGITTASTISNIVFEFGTAQGSNMIAGTAKPIPEPASLLMVALGGGVTAGYLARRRLRARRPASIA